MSLKNLAVLGMTLEPDSPLVECTITISGVPSDVYLCDSLVIDNGVYTDGLQITVSNITVPSVGATIPDPGPYVVPLNASTNINFEKISNKVLRENDLSDTINATPQIPPTPPATDPIDSPISFKIQITNAGQNVVLGE